MKNYCIRISKFVLPLLAFASISVGSQAQSNGLTINGKTCTGTWSLSSSTTGTALTVPDSCLTGGTQCTANGAPTIGSFTPTVGNASTVITVSGANLCNVASVTVNGVAATAVSTGSGTSLTATVGAGTTTGKVAVSTGSGTAISTADFTIAALVTLTSLSPNPFTQGAFITMNGTNFKPGDVYINIGATTIPTSTSSTTTATAYVPATFASGNYQVTATSNGQTTSSIPLTVGAVQGPGDYSIEGDLIPTPSRLIPGVPGGKTPYRAGKTNGPPGNPDPAYPYQFNSYAAADTATKCANATPAITRLWQHNIDFATYQASGANDYVFLKPNEAMAWKFVAPAEGTANIIQYGEGTLVTSTRAYLSISSKPCDFDVRKLTSASYSLCHASEVNGVSIYYKSTTGAVDAYQCKITPGQTYYLNYRTQDARPVSGGGSPTVDSCAASGKDVCGGLVQIK